jgi:hypothetical protein
VRRNIWPGLTLAGGVLLAAILVLLLLGRGQPDDGRMPDAPGLTAVRLFPGDRATGGQTDERGRDGEGKPQGGAVGAGAGGGDAGSGAGNSNSNGAGDGAGGDGVGGDGVGGDGAGGDGAGGGSSDHLARRGDSAAGVQYGAVGDRGAVLGAAAEHD